MRYYCAKIRRSTTAKTRYYRKLAEPGRARYYRARGAVLPWRRGCKKLHPPLLPRRSGTWPGGHGTTAPEERYYRGLLRYYRAEVRYYRRCLRYYRSREQYYHKPINNSQDKVKRRNGGCSKVQGKGGDKEENMYVMIPPKPF